MKLKNFAYAALVAVAAVAFVLGSATTGEAKGKKKAAAAPQHTPWCQFYEQPVCAVKGGNKVTYANSCFAGNDGAAGISQKACAVKKAHAKKKKQAKKHKKAKKAMKKPAKKAAKKKM
jgi:hypothetical protein